MIMRRPASALTGALAIVGLTINTGGASQGCPLLPNSIPVTAATLTATTTTALASIIPDQSKLAYICGYTVATTSTTSAASSQITVVGITGGNLGVVYEFPAAPAMNKHQENFQPECLPASGFGIPISVTVGGGGPGTVVSIYLWGCYANN